jgi:hypothetical protein
MKYRILVKENCSTKKLYTPQIKDKWYKKYKDLSVYDYSSLEAAEKVIDHHHHTKPCRCGVRVVNIIKYKPK